MEVPRASRVTASAATHAVAPLRVANWSVLTVGFAELKSPCARGHARSTHNPMTSPLRLSYFPPCRPMRLAPLDTDTAARWQARNTRRGAARHGELAGAHRGFPELKPPCARGHARFVHNPRTPRLCLSYFPPYQPMRRVAPLDADAAARWQARNTRRGAARRSELVGAHRGFPRAQTAVRSRPRPRHT